jgi:PIN domain nuclease of toxin-antitoxin system
MKPEKYLVDTQTCYLWADGKLPRKVEKELSRSGIVIYYTDISAWEVLIKEKYRETGFTYAMFWQFVNEIHATALRLSRRDLDGYSDLPLFEDHRDPFDRMIIAQAMAANLTLVGGDRKFAYYDGLRVLWD